MSDIKLLIIEATPKRDRANEGQLITTFLQMAFSRKVRLKECDSSIKLKKYLEEQDVTGFDFIHLSGHSRSKEDKDIFAFKLPHGFLIPQQFPKDCFLDCVVTFSACDLGKIRFVDPFMERTGADVVIAPQKGVDFVDAAIWYLNFYYFVFVGKKPVSGAYKITQKHLKNAMAGAFQHWPKLS